LGVVFPQTEIGNDPVAIRDYAQAIEGLGYDHVIVYDHVLGAHPDRFEGRFRPPYTHETPFHEPFVLFGYLAAATQRLELTSSIIILPQRQTALVAKQAAEVDVLSGGRLRLGIGIGWNFVEYEALRENFRNRGRRVEEQVAVMRQLWTEDLVDFNGRWHSMHKVAIRPRPVQQPIPIWFGGGADDVLRRIARIGDGWFPQFRPGPESAATLERLRGYVRHAGREESAVGIEGRVSMFNTPAPDWEETVRWWRGVRATHLSFNTMNAGLGSPAAHLDALRRFREVAVA
jgi:probable F420-dependent oxidoreductase